jgi:type IX secretion system PorP/SprF family membrane protein
MKHFIPIILFLLAGNLLKAQQYPLFTNYVLNDFGFNPAIAGSTDYLDLRMTYRTQWTGLEQAPTTQIISGQAALKAVPMGVGGYIYNDVSGQIRRTGFSGAVCYGIDLGIGKLGLGVSGGFYSFRLSNDLFVQEDTDPTLANAQGGKWTPDLSVGTYFQMKNGAFVGFSVPQILNTKINFSDDSQNTTTVNNLVPHYYAMAGYRLKLNDNLTLEPSVLAKVSEAAPMQFDITMRALLKEKYWVGTSFRTQDAATAMIGYEISRRLSLAYAFDFTVSGLREASNGSHEITLSLRLGGPKDSDGDGIFDPDDECPEEPGTEENKGCPEEEEDDSPSDRDKDGILDDDDKCPDTPGPEENQGCPFGDRDKDGIRDEVDNCPDVPGLAEDKGCPKDDRDGDGILDSADACPEVKGHIANQGCPMDDADGDGIKDIDDKCPKTKGVSSRDGCPMVTPEEREILDLVLRNLYYDTDSDVIRSEALPFLNKLAELMVKRPDWKLRMKGHTDSRASSAYNADLSKRRVEGVLFYLMNRGVTRSQLVTEYFGEEKPAAPNANEKLRQLNRRVELEFVWE